MCFLLIRDTIDLESELYASQLAVRCRDVRFACHCIDDAHISIETSLGHERRRKKNKTRVQTHHKTPLFTAHKHIHIEERTVNEEIHFSIVTRPRLVVSVVVHVFFIVGVAVCLLGRNKTVEERKPNKRLAGETSQASRPVESFPSQFSPDSVLALRLKTGRGRDRTSNGEVEVVEGKCAVGNFGFSLVKFPLPEETPKITPVLHKSECSSGYSCLQTWPALLPIRHIFNFLPFFLTRELKSLNSTINAFNLFCTLSICSENLQMWRNNAVLRRISCAVPSVPSTSTVSRCGIV